MKEKQIFRTLRKQTEIVLLAATLLLLSTSLFAQNPHPITVKFNAYAKSIKQNPPRPMDANQFKFWWCFKKYAILYESEIDIKER
jgi:hypothetical protein